MRSLGIYQACGKISLISEAFPYLPTLNLQVHLFCSRELTTPCLIRNRWLPCPVQGLKTGKLQTDAMSKTHSLLGASDGDKVHEQRRKQGLL